MKNKAKCIASYLKNHNGSLPPCYLTKSQAQKVGWEHGALSNILPGHYIGGDIFHNDKTNLPSNEIYHECDLLTPFNPKRGTHRLVYSNHHYYYTKDHYESFIEIDPG